MMDVEAPEPRKPVKGAVDPILRKVRQDQHSQEDAGQPKDLRSPAGNAEQPQQDRSDQGRLQHPTEEGDRVMRSKDRRGEKPGKVQAEHAKEAERASEHRTNSAYPPGAQVGRLVIAEDAPEVSVERRRRGVGRTHATSLVEPAVWERNRLVRTTSGARATSAGAGQPSRLSGRVGAPAQVAGPPAPPAGRTPPVGRRRTLRAAPP